MNLFLDRIIRAFNICFALSIRPFIKIKKGRVFCWAYSFKMYGCNPMYISNYILDHYEDMFEVIWALDEDADHNYVDHRIKIVKPGTFEFLKYIYSSEFVINNSRNNIFGNFFFKKKKQKYIQAWHGSCPLKKIEKDAEKVLGPAYVRRAKLDSQISDLFISDSNFFSNLIRTSFWYDGEILQKGVPRNDIFFNEKKIASLKKKIYGLVKKIPEDAKIVLYAPTFRDIDNEETYAVNWKNILNDLERKFKSPICLFLRLHPNSLHRVNINNLLTDERMIDMCFYHDMQELLCISDILITDYSSSMFDFTIMDKVCFLYARDVEEYNRGFYFDIKELPFPFADSESKLIENINTFDYHTYLNKITDFKNNVLGIHNDGNASKEVVQWMIEQLK